MISDRTIDAVFNNAYKRMDALSEAMKDEDLKKRASDLASEIDALHHDFAIRRLGEQQ